MTTTQTARAAELAAQFAASKRATQQTCRQALHAGAAERRAIVLELLETFRPFEVAQLLGISAQRVGQIAKGEQK